MKKDLYYCKFWKHIKYKKYEICVSDIIFLENRTMAQLHMIIMRKGRVVREISSIKFNQFEENIRDYIRNEFYNNGMLKVWYFNIDDSPVNPKIFH